ncbi:MAG TPA: hypothetical protein VFK76_07370 [Gaiellaceae bacterium]|nr:hypothetical protein [Gaiellaceae bacterium]
MGTTSKERAAEAREAKLENVREQVASGSLVIRQMTHEERRKWAERDARSTPEERTRREAALEGRRQRTERLRARET